MSPKEKQIEQAITGCENILYILEWMSGFDELCKERNILLKIGENEKDTRDLKKLYEQILI